MPAKRVVEGRRERKKRDTRERIFQVARELFRTKGYVATTVEEIAEGADVSKATFFNHYDGKQTLLSRIAHEGEAGLERAVRMQLRQPASTRDRLLGFFVGTAGPLEANRDFTRMMVIESLRGIADPQESRERLARMHRAIEAVLQAGVEQGEVRTDFPVTELAELVASMYNSALINWLSEKHTSLAKRMRESADLLAALVRPPATLSGAPPATTKRARR